MKEPRSAHSAQRAYSFAALALLTGIAALQSGCALPSSGPSPARIKSEAATEDGKNAGSYHLVEVNRETVSILSRSSHSSRSGSLTLEKQGSPVSHAVSPGDVLEITIFENGGLFSAPGSSAQSAGTPSNTLPSQVVDDSGTISVPYIGRLKVTGRSLQEVEAEIAEGLKNKTINPQVIVTLSDRKGGNLVTISGDVKSPTQLPISFAGTRLLDAISAAGGNTGQAHETSITVIRGREQQSDILSSILRHPDKNISLRAGDTVLLRHEPQTFLAFGAAGQNGVFPFTTEEHSLAEGMAKAGGLLDARANPARVFLYRMELRSVAAKLGAAGDAPTGSYVPIIYQIDLTSPEGFFLARNLQLRNKDILYFPNAGSVGVHKFMSLVNAATAPARSGVGMGYEVDRLVR